VKISSDPEPRAPNQVVENRLDSFNQSNSLGLGQHAEQADNTQAEGGRDPSATPLIHQEHVCSPL
jgi:hypothetical protein